MTDVVVQEKTCKGCGLTKPTSEFFKRSASRDGLQSYCKACSAAQQKAWYHAVDGFARRRGRSRTTRNADYTPQPAPAPAPAPAAAPASFRAVMRMTVLDTLMAFMPGEDGADKLIALHDAQQRVMRRRALVRELHNVVTDLVAEPTDALCSAAADLLIELEEVL